MGESMKAVRMNKNLWTDVVVEDFEAATPLCTRSLTGGRTGCGGGRLLHCVSS